MIAVPRNAAAMVMIGIMGVAACGCAAKAQADPAPAAPPTPVAVEVLTPRALVPDDVRMRIHIKTGGHHAAVIRVSNPSRIMTQKVTLQPGAQIPWHTHPGPVFVTVAEGELTYVSSAGCTKRRYPSSTAFVDAGHGHIHAAYNSARTVTVFLATFLETSQSGPITIPAQAPAGCTLPTG